MSDFQSGDALARTERLEAVAALDVSPETVRVLEDLLAEVSEHFDLPIVVVSVVMGEAQRFLASRGLGGWLAEVEGTPIEWSFCANAVRDEAPFVVEDATVHPLVSGNPLVAFEGIRCYAGVPLRGPGGAILGSLCVIGGESRTFSAVEMEGLLSYGRRAERLLAAG